MFTVMVGDRFLMSRGFCALTDWLNFPAFALQFCSSATHSHFSVLGRGSKLICFCAKMHMCLPGLSSRAGACGSLDRRGLGGTGVCVGGSPCHPAQTLQFPAAQSPLPNVSAEQSWEGTTATCLWRWGKALLPAGHRRKQMWQVGWKGGSLLWDFTYFPARFIWA